MKTLKGQNLKNRELHFLEDIKKIENKHEDENETSSLFDIFNHMESSCAFFTILTIITSIFNYDLQTRIQDSDRDQAIVGNYDGRYVYHIESLKNAKKANLALCSISVLFFSKISA